MTGSNGNHTGTITETTPEVPGRGVSGGGAMQIYANEPAAAAAPSSRGVRRRRAVARPDRRAGQRGRK